MTLKRLLLSVALFSAGESARAETLEGHPRVVDGDTLAFSSPAFNLLRDKNNLQRYVRLYGIDAPESKQNCTAEDGSPVSMGALSTLALGMLIDNNLVECELGQKDLYQRDLGKCAVRGNDINLWLVEHGYAFAFQRYARDYVPAENTAKAANLGVWHFKCERPWDWRKKHE